MPDPLRIDPPPTTREDGYLGNIWGWRFSLFGAGLILGLLLLALALSYARDKPFLDARDAPAATEPIRDGD